MKKNIIYQFVLVLFLLSACEDPHERYQLPSWLEGSIWKVLEQKGDYSIFLAGVEKIGLKKALEGQGLFTVVAPDDAAFEEYFSKNGYSSLDDIPEDELKQIISIHLVKFTYHSPEELVNQNDNGADIADEITGKHLHITMAKRKPSFEKDRLSGKEVAVYHGLKRLGFFGNTLLVDRLGIVDPQTEYQMVFPETVYESDRYYAANAMITSDPIPAENGYVYTVSQVVKPPKTIDEILEENSDNYSECKKLFDRFAKYSYSSYISDTYAAGVAGADSLFLKKSVIGLNIAAEADESVEGSTGSKKVGQSSMSVAIVPNDAVLSNYFQEKLFSLFGDFQSIPFMTLKYLARGFVMTRSFTTPGKLADGSVMNLNGDVYNLNVSTDIEKIEFGSNGIFYGVNNLLEPRLFESVVGPGFFDTELKSVPVLFEKANYLLPFVSEDTDYSLFLPTNTATENAGLFIDYGELETSGVAGITNLDEEDVSSSVLERFVKSHILFGKFEFGETPVYLNTLNDYMAIEVVNGKIFNGDDLSDDEAPMIIENYDRFNGTSYKIDKAIVPVENSNILSIIQENEKFSKFYALLENANLINSDDLIDFIGGEHFNAFIPVNGAVEDAENEGIIPEGGDDLKEFIKYFFVPLEANNRIEYLLPAYQYPSMLLNTVSEDLRLSTSFEKVYAPLYVSGDGQQLVIMNNDKSEFANILPEKLYIGYDGVVAPIDNVIKYNPQ